MDFDYDERGVPTLTLRADDQASLSVAMAVFNTVELHRRSSDEAKMYREAARGWLVDRANHPKLPA